MVRLHATVYLITEYTILPPPPQLIRIFLIFKRYRKIVLRSLHLNYLIVVLYQFWML